MRGRMVRIVAVVAMAAALLAVAPAGAQTDEEPSRSRGADLAQAKAVAEARPASDDAPDLRDGSARKLGAQARAALETGVTPRAFDDCLNSVYLDSLGEIVGGLDLDVYGIFSDCRTLIFNAFVAAPFTAAAFDAFGAYFDADQNPATGCGGFEFLVAAFDLAGQVAEVQEQPTCDPDTWVLRTEEVTVNADPADGYLEVSFPVARILGDEGPFNWYMVVQPPVPAPSDFGPDTGFHSENQVPIVPGAPTGVVASTAAGGGATVRWNRPAGDVGGYVVQWRRVGGAGPVADPVAEAEPAPPPVVGGEDISITQAPWSVAIYVSGTDPFDSQYCGGVLVAPQKVLTAAHCVDAEAPGDIRVLVGQTALSAAAEAQTSAVLGIDIHPNYERRPSLRFDVAVLTIERSFNISPLPRISTNTSLPTAGTPAVVTGWGTIDIGSDTPQLADILQRGSLQILASPGQGCGSWDVTLFVPLHHVCAGVPGGGVDACFGDSGGGLVTTDGVNFDLVGIVSFGFGVCGDPDFPGAYARVATYASWINQSVASPAWSSQALTCGGAVCTYRVLDLVPNQRYEFRVAATNDGGAGDWSASAFAFGGLLRCQGRTVTIVALPGVITRGTSGPDVIWGSDGPDDIRAGKGPDTICANGGNDRVEGGSGADRIDLGGGNDFALGGKGTDIIDGGNGSDSIRGQGKADRINGQKGPDTIDGGGGDDIINGGSGSDNIEAGKGDDTVTGGKGNDEIRGGSGEDDLTGNGGRDRIYGGKDDDDLDGGGKNDTLDGQEGFDICTGGNGTDSMINCERRFP